MTITVRLLAPAAALPKASQTVTFPPNGQGGTMRTQTSAPGQVLDANVQDADDLVLAGGWIKIGMSGPTTARPNAGAQGNTDAWAAPTFRAGPGFTYYDTTLGELIVWDGATWRDCGGNSV